jgi:hypothetical protein
LPRQRHIEIQQLGRGAVVGFRRHEPFLTRGPPSAYLFLTIRRCRTTCG